MGEAEINGFLSHLALRAKVSASTQNQALSTILFLYCALLKRKVGKLGDLVRARRPKRLPTVMTKKEARAVLGHLEDKIWIMDCLMYGSGLRLKECLRLRVQVWISVLTRLSSERARASRTGSRCYPSPSRDRLRNISRWSRLFMNRGVRVFGAQWSRSETARPGIEWKPPNAQVGGKPVDARPGNVIIVR